MKHDYRRCPDLPSLEHFSWGLHYGWARGQKKARSASTHLEGFCAIHDREHYLTVRGQGNVRVWSLRNR